MTRTPVSHGADQGAAHHPVSDPVVTTNLLQGQGQTKCEESVSMCMYNECGYASVDGGRHVIDPIKLAEHVSHYALGNFLHTLPVGKRMSVENLYHSHRV